MSPQSVKTFSVASLLILAAGAACAQATPAAPDAGTKPFPPTADALPITGNIGFTSNYVARGFTQNWGKPAVQGGLDYAHPSGVYVGTWMSSLSGSEFRGGTIEWDLYAGYTGTAGPLGYTLGAVYYAYPGSTSPFIEGRKYDYAEIKFGLSYSIYSLNYYHTATKDWFGTVPNGRGSGYVELNVNPDLGAGYTLQLHAGAGAIKKNAYANWKDYKVGLLKTFDGGWTLTGAVTKATDKNSYWTVADYAVNASDDTSGYNYVKPLGKTQFALTLGKTF
jgi:uncharacterized protein (TIGR02001 family)